MTMITPGRFIRGMEQTPILLDALLNGVTQERALAARDGDDGWNIVEILCHLRDFEQIFFDRAQQMVNEDNPILVPHDHEALAIEKAYAKQDLNDVFETLCATRSQFVAWLKARDEADWAKTGVHPEAGPYSVLEQALQVGYHDIDHLQQIARTLGLPMGNDHIEPLTRF